MWSKRITSHSSEFPNRADVIQHLLHQMQAKKMVGSWAHIELVEESGWFSNLLWGKARWVEVAMNSESFDLNLGYRKNQSAELPEIPANWQKTGKMLWNVPVTDLQQLLDWIDSAFNK